MLEALRKIRADSGLPWLLLFIVCPFIGHVDIEEDMSVGLCVIAHALHGVCFDATSLGRPSAVLASGQRGRRLTSVQEKGSTPLQSPSTLALHFAHAHLTPPRSPAMESGVWECWKH